MKSGVLVSGPPNSFPRTARALTAEEMLDTQGRLTSTRIWQERKELPADTVAKIEAYVVPQSGVGWIDCDWGCRIVPPSRGPTIRPERRRILADWDGRDHSSVVRDVIKVADEWFAYCREMAEREAAAAALAAEEPSAPSPPKGPWGVTGPSGPALPNPVPPSPNLISGGGELAVTLGAEELKELLSAMKPEDVRGVLRELWHAGRVLSPPEAGSDSVEGVLPLLAGQAIGVSPEGAGDGLSDLGDHIPEPKVSG